MAIFYKLYQDKRNTSHFKDKWYARAMMTATVDTDDLAEIIQRNCTCKRSDVLAVLTELAEVMRGELLASHSVKLNGLGIFRVGLATKPADKASDFSPAKNIVGMRINFLPEVRISPDRKRQRPLISGASVREAPKNAVDTKKPKTPKQGG